MLLKAALNLLSLFCFGIFFHQLADKLLQQTEDLHLHIQAKDELLLKMEEERKPLKQAASGNLEILDTLSEVRLRLQKEQDEK